MRTEIKTIWPEEAIEILKTRNLLNRKISDLFVAKLANDIKNDAFLLTHQGIAFDSNGNLIDGQHRLAACVKANKPIRILVTEGIPISCNANGVSLNTFEIIDSGKTRTAGQMLNISGIKYATTVAATAKLVALMCLKSSKNIGITSAQIHKILNIAEDSINKCVQIAKTGSIFKAPSWIISPVALYHITYPDKAEKFLSEFVNLSKPEKQGHPSRCLAVYYQNNTAAGGGQQQIAWVKYTSFAIHSYHIEKPINRVCASDLSSEWLLNLNSEVTEQIASTVSFF